jgi:hypothetical protein
MPTKQQFINRYFPLISSAESNAISCLPSVSGGQVATVKYSNKIIQASLINNFVGKFDLRTKKLFDYLLLLLTKTNLNSSDTWGQQVVFTLSDYLSIMGLQDTSSNRDRYFSLILQNLDVLRNTKITSDTNVFSGLVSEYGSLGASGLKLKRAILSGMACFAVDLNAELITHLCQQRYLIRFYGDIFKLVEQNNNAYALAKRMMQHYSQRGNRNKQNRNLLRVDTLLSCCPEVTSNRQENIKFRFETALNALSRLDKRDADKNVVYPMITWQYRNTNAMPRRVRKDIWNRLCVQFELLGFPETTAKLAKDLLVDNTVYYDFLDEELSEYTKVSNPQTVQSA